MGNNRVCKCDIKTKKLNRPTENKCHFTTVTMTGDDCEFIKIIVIFPFKYVFVKDEPNINKYFASIIVFSAAFSKCVIPQHSLPRRGLCLFYQAKKCIAEG